MQNTQFLRRKEAGEYLVSRYGFGAPGTLAVLASTGGGPEYSKFGRFAIYQREKLDEWALSKISAPRRLASRVEAAE